MDFELVINGLGLQNDAVGYPQNDLNNTQRQDLRQVSKKMTTKKLPTEVHRQPIFN